MRIRTITCHDVGNYGASLQAYSLMRHLQRKRTAPRCRSLNHSLQ